MFLFARIDAGIRDFSENTGNTAGLNSGGSGEEEPPEARDLQYRRKENCNTAGIVKTGFFRG